MTPDPVALLTALIAVFEGRSDVVAQAWASHLRSDLRAMRLYWLAHADDAVGEVASAGRP